ncbi:hypothetical protein, partial [Caballeronia calidae]|uniref:hypothetical protein n=1 Tax=Caballeronia calidae TaxID=1777139 RepID=UPI001E620844
AISLRKDTSVTLPEKKEHYLMHQSVRALPVHKLSCNTAWMKPVKERLTPSLKPDISYMVASHLQGNRS